MQSRSPRRGAALLGMALLVPLLLVACAQDPFERPGTWNATNDNEHNLRLMVAVPADLEHGRGTETSLGATSAAAIGRMRDDKLKPLASDIDNFQVGGSNGSTAQP
jgi:hypothetical protein